MSVSCGIYLRERGDESGNLFNIGPYVKSWSFQLLRRQGCGPAKFTAVMTDAEWDALDATGLLTSDTVVHFYFKMNEAVEHRTWSGTLKTFPLDKNTPPDRRRRRFTCAPVWSQLKKPGCLLLYAFDDDETVQTMVQALIGQGIAADTDVSTGTGGVTAGSDFQPGRAMFIDQEAAKCVELLAQVSGDVVHGVSGSDDLLYFADETNDTEEPVVTFRMGDHGDGVVKFTRTTKVRRNQANHYKVQGRTARTGNPMMVEYEDPALDTDDSLLRRTQIVKAPDLVAGATLLRYAQYLVARDKDPLTVAVLTAAGIDTKFAEEGDVIRTWEQLNGNCAVQDEDGNPLGQWPIRGITYTMNGKGAYGAKFEIGDALEQDLVDAYGMRETLRDIEVHQLKEFSNQIELHAMVDSWLTWLYVQFVIQNGMGSSATFSLNTFRDIDFDHADTGGIVKRADEGAITGLMSPADENAVGQFITYDIETGMHFDEFALRRHLLYPVLIEGVGGGLIWDDFLRAPLDLPPEWEDLYWVPATIDGDPSPWSGIRPKSEPDPTWVPNQKGFLITTRTVPRGTHIDWRVKWMRQRNRFLDAAYLVFGWDDEAHGDYHFIELTDHYPSENLLRLRAGQVIDGVTTYSSTIAGAALPIHETEPYMHFNFRIEPDTDNGTVLFRFRKMNTDGTWHDWGSQSSELGWYAPTGYSMRAGFGQKWEEIPEDDLMREHAPVWLWVKFDTVEAGNDWYISRDGESWEGPFNPDTGATVALGAYAGGGTEQDYILIKGKVAYPQLLAAYGVAWK